MSEGRSIGGGVGFSQPVEKRAASRAVTPRKVPIKAANFMGATIKCLQSRVKPLPATENGRECEWHMNVGIQLCILEHGSNLPGRITGQTAPDLSDQKNQLWSADGIVEEPTHTFRDLTQRQRPYVVVFCRQRVRSTEMTFALAPYCAKPFIGRFGCAFTVPACEVAAKNENLVGLQTLNQRWTNVNHF